MTVLDELNATYARLKAGEASPNAANVASERLSAKSHVQFARAKSYTAGFRDARREPSLFLPARNRLVTRPPHARTLLDVLVPWAVWAAFAGLIVDVAVWVRRWS